jgi:predicted alpha/beta hydrolase family esterase
MRYPHFELLPLGAFDPRSGRSGPMRLHGGGDGGGSSSSNTTTTSTTNVDRRQVVDNGAVGITSDGGSVNITNTKTDYGVIGAAAGLLDEAIAALTASTAAAGNAIESAYKNTASINAASASQAIEASRASSDLAISGVLSSAAAAGNAIERAYNSASSSNAAASSQAINAVLASSNDQSTAYKQAGDFANAISGRAFDLAATSSDTGFKTINTAIGFVKDVLTLASDSTKLAASGVSSAYSTAQDSATGTRFLMTAALAIGGIILVINLPKMKGA